jgi:Holliday junction resolvase-like predicted endonuclease
MTPNQVLNNRNTGRAAEQLAADAFERAEYKVLNLNDMRCNFRFADLVAEKDGKWYAVSVKGRHRIMANGVVNTGYKLKRKDAAVAVDEIRRLAGLHCIPAFAAVEFDGDAYSVYFDLLERSPRKNRIGMKESERGLYQCLVYKEPHHGNVRANHKVTRGIADTGRNRNFS